MDSLFDKLFSQGMLPHNYSDAYALEWAEYKRALQRVEDLDPGLVGGPGITPLVLMDEAVVALVNAAWLNGSRIGAAFARAEDTVAAPFRICQVCNGTGRNARGSHKGEGCRACNELGFTNTAGEWVTS